MAPSVDPLVEPAFAPALPLLKALADGTRLRILAALAGGERCVCELQDALDGVGQSLLSFHLKTLKEAGLVRHRREGRWVHYRIRPEALAELEEMLGSMTSGVDAASSDPARCR
jgi:ArsR family transcriptional regulator, arsenate/arsenite/antimonite-responsive transcriptional repressor